MHQRARKSFRHWISLLALTSGLSMEASANLIIDLEQCQVAIPRGYALKLGDGSRSTHFYFHEKPEKGTITISRGEADLLSLKEELVRRLNYTVDEGTRTIGDYMIFRSSQGVAELDAGVAHIMGWTVRFQGQTVSLIESFYDDCERTRNPWSERSPGSGLAK